MADQEREKEIEQEQETSRTGTNEANKEEKAGTQPPEDNTGQEEETAEENGGEEEEQGPPEGEDPKTWAEKRAAKKQAKLDKKAQGYKDQIEQLEDKVKRQLAEFENFRNRSRPCSKRGQKVSLKRYFLWWTILREDWPQCRRKRKKILLWME